MKATEKLKEFLKVNTIEFDSEKHIIQADLVKSLGVSLYSLRKLEESGRLTKLRNYLKTKVFYELAEIENLFK